MAGYFIYSLDRKVFQQLTTTPTMAQCLILADPIVDDLEGLLDEDDGDRAADASKWPLEREPLAKSIRKRLSSADWYADLTMGDAAIWDNYVLSQLDDKAGEKIGIGFQCENDQVLYWNAANTAARHGASMMAEPKFGNSGFRYSGHSRSRIDLTYSIYLPAQTRLLLEQLEKVVPHFETLPGEDYGDRDQFFRGLLEPVRKIVATGRVMWVQTDT